MIKIKINKNGELILNRINARKSQYCVNDRTALCCDLCPAFEEPIIDDVITLQICMTSLHCLAAEFQDDRR